MKFKKICFPEKQTVAVVESEISLLQSTQVLIENQYSIISPGTELAMYTMTHVGFKDPKNNYVRYPFYPGYASSGTVIDVGPEVKGLNIGDIVFHRGGHASHHLCNETDVHVLGNKSDARKAVFVPLCLISLCAVRLSSISLGTNVCVVGQGLIGNLAAQLLKLAGANKVFCIDRSTKRLSISQQCKLHLTFTDGPNSVSEIELMTNGNMCRVVVEATGVPQCINNCFSYISESGELILLGSPRGDVFMDPYNNIHKKGVSVIGAHVMQRRKHENPIDEDSTQLMLQMIEDERLIVDPLITKEIRSDQVQEAYESLLNAPDDNLGIIVSLKQW